MVSFTNISSVVKIRETRLLFLRGPLLMMVLATSVAFSAGRVGDTTRVQPMYCVCGGVYVIYETHSLKRNNIIANMDNFSVSGTQYNVV